ncbi:MAG: type III secretion system export apparatus subunit SctT [Rhizobacter sp.]|jgi:type III secretion protein T
MPELDMMHVGAAFGDLLKTVALCSLRLFVVFLILPATAGDAMQGMVRNGMVVLFGMFVAAGMSWHDAGALSASTWLMLAVKEAIIGLVLGFAASTVFWVAECVGALIDTQAGYNNVQLTNPLSGQQSTPVSDTLLHLVIAVFFAMGGMLVLLGALFESFRLWPLLAPLPSMQGFSDVFFLNEVDNMMTMTVKFAAPVLLVLVLIDVGFGLVTRAADKLEPNSLSQPVKGAVAMLLLALLAGVFIAEVRQFLLPTDLTPRLQKLLPGH